jgi:cellobiose phosphorylase
VKYGKFSPDGKEFIISRFDTPKPWVNYLTNGKFTSIISQVGSGHCFYLDSEYHPVTRRTGTELIEAVPGKCLFLRDNKNGEIWNPNVAPLMKTDEYEARHGFGYTVISSRYSGISAKTTFFVSMSDDTEIWLIELTNKGRTSRDLGLFSYADLVLGDLTFEMVEPWFANASKEIAFKNGALVATKKYVKAPDRKSSIHWPCCVFITSPIKPVQYETARERFIGMYRSIVNPTGVVTGRLSSQGCSGVPIAASFKWNIRLKPGETKSLSLAMGIAPHDDERALARLVEKYRVSGTASREFGLTCAHWEQLLGRLTIATPDRDMNIDINYWTKYQVLINGLTWRNTNDYYGTSIPGNGAGGYRNVIQDAEGMLTLDPGAAEANIRAIGGYQTADGIYAHHTPRPEIGAAPMSLGAKVDDPLWLLLAVEGFIRETGNSSILTEQIPYIGGTSGPMWEHLAAGIDRLIDYTGARGLPLLKTGDWNDALDGAGKEGKGESPWMGMFICYTMRIAAGLFRRFLAGTPGAVARAEKYAAKAGASYTAVNDHCWNGEWFVRAFRDDGTTLGDRHCREGKIFLEPNIWATISGATDPDRALTALKSADKYLTCDYGMQMCAPSFTAFDPKIGIISAFAPGTHENGAAFSQATIFAMVAWAMQGRPDKAIEMYKKITPIGKSDKALRIRQLEPYCQIQYVDGRDSPQYGKGACHWLTGTAAWVYKGVVEWILGVRAEYDGLRVDPCIPESWDRFEVVRRFRGDTYVIKVENPSHVARGVKKSSLDGVALEGNCVPVAGDGKEHRVEVILG